MGKNICNTCIVKIRLNFDNALNNLILIIKCLLVQCKVALINKQTKQKNQHAVPNLFWNSRIRFTLILYVIKREFWEKRCGWILIKKLVITTHYQESIKAT